VVEPFNATIEQNDYEVCIKKFVILAPQNNPAVSDSMVVTRPDRWYETIIETMEYLFSNIRPQTSVLLTSFHMRSRSLGMLFAIGTRRQPFSGKSSESCNQYNAYLPPLVHQILLVNFNFGVSDKPVYNRMHRLFLSS
jgi:hypothetical protein